jgi:hypothetical protein
VFIEFNEKDYSTRIIAAKITHIESDPASPTCKIYVANRDHPILVQESIDIVQKKIEAKLDSANQ